MKKVRVKDILEDKHVRMNEVVMGTAAHLNDAYFVVKLDDLIKERNLTQKDLAQMTGMRIGTISDLVNGKGLGVNKVQLFALMSALRVTKLSDIYEVMFEPTLENEFETESNQWVQDKSMPASVKEMYKENVLKASGLNKL